MHSYLKAWYCKERILGEHLLISSLPGTVSRKLFKSRGSAKQLRNSTCLLKAKPGKLDIKRCQPSLLFVSLSVSWFTLQTGNYDLIIRIVPTVKPE